MPLEQFLTGSSLPWLRPEDQNGAEITRGANLASSFMENSMRQQEMQQKAQMNPIAMQIAKDDEQIKQLQIAQGLFMQKERVNKEAGAAAAAGVLATLPDQEGGVANFPQTLDAVIKGTAKYGNDFLDNPFTEKMLADSQKAYQTKNSLENFQKNLAIKQGQVDVNQQKADTAQQRADDLAKTNAEKEARLLKLGQEKIDLQKEVATAKNPDGLKAGDTAPLINKVTGQPEQGVSQFWNGHQMLIIRKHTGEMTDYQRGETIVALEKLRKSYEENKATMSPEAEAASRTHIRQMENSLKSADQSAPAPSSQQPQGKVKVSKDGKEWLLPAGQLQDAIKQGYKKAE